MDWIVSFFTGILAGLVVLFITKSIEKQKTDQKKKPRITILFLSGLVSIIVIFAIKIAFNFCLLGSYDKQTYWPPPKKGDIYTVIDKKTSGTICVIVEWEKFSIKERIDASNYRGIVLYLKHLKPDSKPMTVKAKDAIVKIPLQGEPPDEWTDPQYKQVSW